MSESPKRTIARTICWRIVATLVTAIWAGWSGAIWANIVLIAIQYIHERAWLKIKWGTE